VLAAAVAVAAPAATPTMFETLRWTAPGAELAALTSQPAACPVFGLQDAALVDAGQALFNSPALLGGQAAKAGLNCASCHVNGRDNAHFLLSGVSDQPGTADVTNSFFSAARGNGRFDPIIIPDLAVPGKVSRDPAAGALEPFIRMLIVEEFSGREPTAAMLAALGAYIRAIRLCPGDGARFVAHGLRDQLSLVNAALTGAADMAERGETQTARALIAAARHQLGLVSERYAGPALAPERAQLLGASRALQRLGDQPITKTVFADAARRWHNDFDAKLAKRLLKQEPQSLYNSRNLGFVALQRDNR